MLNVFCNFDTFSPTSSMQCKVLIIAMMVLAVFTAPPVQLNQDQKPQRNTRNPKRNPKRNSKEARRSIREEITFDSSYSPDFSDDEEAECAAIQVVIPDVPKSATVEVQVPETVVVVPEPIDFQVPEPVEVQVPETVEVIPVEETTTTTTTTFTDITFEAICMIIAGANKDVRKITFIKISRELLLQAIKCSSEFFNDFFIVNLQDGNYYLTSNPNKVIDSEKKGYTNTDFVIPYGFMDKVYGSCFNNLDIGRFGRFNNELQFVVVGRIYCCPNPSCINVTNPFIKNDRNPECFSLYCLPNWVNYMKKLVLEFYIGSLHQSGLLCRGISDVLREMIDDSNFSLYDAINLNTLFFNTHKATVFQGNAAVYGVVLTQPLAPLLNTLRIEAKNAQSSSEVTKCADNVHCFLDSIACPRPQTKQLSFARKVQVQVNNTDEVIMIVDNAWTRDDEEREKYANRLKVLIPQHLPLQYQPQFPMRYPQPQPQQYFPHPQFAGMQRQQYVPHPQFAGMPQQQFPFRR